MKEELRSFSVGEVVELFEVDATALGDDQVRYYTSTIFEERVLIRFGGVDYSWLPVEMDAPATSGDGKPAQPTFRIATSGSNVAALVAQFDDFRGAVVRRFFTLAKFLDLRPDGQGGVEANPDADAAAVFGLDQFIVDRKLGVNKRVLEMQLTSPFDVQGVQLPRRVALKRYCDRDYRFSNDDGTFTTTGRNFPCPYAGSAFFTVDDQSTADPTQDMCSKTPRGCELRFGKEVSLPGAFFPGIGRVGEAQ